MAARRANPPERRVALFVEGTTVLTPRGRNDLAELWRYQCSQISSLPPDRLDVLGFSKQQIVLMDAAHAHMAGAGKVPLDVAIERQYRRQAFDDLVIAFDAHPANQAIRLVEGDELPCLRHEKDFVLERLAASEILPAAFRAAAQRLLRHYAANRARPRADTRPPIGQVELVYMDPTFEAMLLQDCAALRRVFGLASAPGGWPSLPFAEDRPDFALRKIVNEHRRTGPNHLRLTYDAAKHAWAQEILRNARPSSPIWAHDIATRLGKVLG